ncbi:MAG TPA: response regulator [Pseudolabrys sp.]|nr:response regulator [Pseudolabrys sp.]
MQRDDAFAPFTGKHFLVLDDEFLIGSDMQQILENAGARSVAYANTVDDAHAILQKGGPLDLAVLDLFLGRERQNSLGIAEILTKRKIPIVFITGATGDDAHRERFPNVPVLVKPYHESEFIAVVRGALRRRSSD